MNINGNMTRKGFFKCTPILLSNRKKKYNLIFEETAAEFVARWKTGIKSDMIYNPTDECYFFTPLYKNKWVSDFLPNTWEKNPQYYNAINKLKQNHSKIQEIDHYVELMVILDSLIFHYKTITNEYGFYNEILYNYRYGTVTQDKCHLTELLFHYNWLLSWQDKTIKIIDKEILFEKLIAIPYKEMHMDQLTENILKQKAPNEIIPLKNLFLKQFLKFFYFEIKKCRKKPKEDYTKFYDQKKLKRLIYLKLNVLEKIFNLIKKNKKKY